MIYVRRWWLTWIIPKWLTIQANHSSSSSLWYPHLAFARLPPSFLKSHCKVHVSKKPSLTAAMKTSNSSYSSSSLSLFPSSPVVCSHHLTVKSQWNKGQQSCKFSALSSLLICAWIYAFVMNRHVVGFFKHYNIHENWSCPLIPQRYCGLFPEHHNRMNITVKQIKLIFWFPSTYKSYVYTLL